MRVINIWEIKAPVILQYEGKKIVIPNDGMVYFIPDYFKGSKFSGMLREVPEGVPLKKFYPKQFNTVKDPKTGQIKVVPEEKPKAIEVFPECIYTEPDFSEFEGVEVTPQNPEYFPSYRRDKDDPSLLVDVKDMPTIAERREEVKNEDKPLKKIKINNKVREEARRARREKLNLKPL